MNKQRWQLWAVAAAFFGPFLIAVWLYFSGQSVQLGANHGFLLEPIINLKDEAAESPLHEANPEQWLFVYANIGDCDDGCRTALYKARQSRTMLGREMDRVTRVFLHGESLPDTLWLAEEHAELVLVPDVELGQLLITKKPEAVPAGGFFLIDPLGNLVLYFPPGIEPRDMVGDIKRLLKLSQIG